MHSLFVFTLNSALKKSWTILQRFYRSIDLPLFEEQNKIRFSDEILEKQTFVIERETEICYRFSG